MMKLKPYLLLAALSGCTPYSESFDCPPGQGVGCKSLSVINQMVEEGKLPIENVPIEGKEAASQQSLIQAQNTQVPPSPALSSDAPMRIWMTAYEDKAQGVIHEASVIYVALKDSPSLGGTKENVSQIEISQVATLRAESPQATTTRIEKLPMRNH